METILRGFAIRRAVILALLTRELKTRFKGPLGTGWVFIQPLLHVAIWVGLFYLFRNPITNGMSVPIYVFVGIMPWLLFKNSVMFGMNAISANQNLYNYPQVLPIDALLARQLLEVVLFTVVYISGYSVLYMLGFNDIPNDPLTLIFTSMLVAILGFGLSMFLCISCFFFPPIKEMVPFIMRPLYYLTGIFFSINQVPVEYQYYFSRNPMLQAIEISRSTYTLQTLPDCISITYLVECSIVSFAVGLGLYFVARHRLRQGG